MSETKEPYKWYWAYEPTSANKDGIYIFPDRDTALDHAIKNGEFDEVCGKDYFMDHENELLFEIREDEIENEKVLNKLIANYEVEATCNDCGEDIEECHWTNYKGQSVHMTTHTNGHYYSDGSVACDGCHEGAR